MKKDKNEFVESKKAFKPKQFTAEALNTLYDQVLESSERFNNDNPYRRNNSHLSTILINIFYLELNSEPTLDKLYRMLSCFLK